MSEDYERRIATLERHLSDLSLRLNTMERAVEGRDGILHLIDIIKRDIEEITDRLYGEERTRQRGLVTFMEEQTKKERDRDVTLRNLKWLIGALGLSLSGVLTVLVNLARSAQP